MRLETLQQLWRQKYPGGAISRGARAGQFAVSYRDDGHRPYIYRSRSVYALAERLELIPDVDIMQEARETALFLAQYPSAAYRAHAGLIDTMRALHPAQGARYEYRAAGLDEYDRNMSEYYLITGKEIQ